MAHRNSWFTELKDADVPVRKLLVYQRVAAEPNLFASRFSSLGWETGDASIFFFQMSDPAMLTISTGATEGYLIFTHPPDHQFPEISWEPKQLPQCVTPGIWQ